MRNDLCPIIVMESKVVLVVVGGVFLCVFVCLGGFLFVGFFWKVFPWDCRFCSTVLKVTEKKSNFAAWQMLLWVSHLYHPSLSLLGPKPKLSLRFCCALLIFLCELRSILWYLALLVILCSFLWVLAPSLQKQFITFLQTVLNNRFGTVGHSWACFMWVSLQKCWKTGHNVHRPQIPFACLWRISSSHAHLLCGFAE